MLDEHTIGRVRGARDNSYTLGVICEKVGRYAERIHHPDRLLHPMKRKGPKGSGEFQRISWDDAMAETAEAMLKAEAEYGPTSVWPYFYAGTMGYVMRDGINRLAAEKGLAVVDDKDLLDRHLGAPWVSRRCGGRTPPHAGVVLS